MSTSINIGVTGLDEVLAQLRELPGATEAAMDAGVEAVGLIIASEAKRLAPVDRGTLRGSIATETTERGDRSVKGRVGSAMAHAAAMELGAGPAVGREKFFPPMEPIIAWVRRKAMVTKSGKDTSAKTRMLDARRTLKRFGHLYDQNALTNLKRASRVEAADPMDLDGDTIESVAFVIARSIYRKGIKPRRFMSTALSNTRDRLIPKFEAAFRRTLKERLGSK